MKTISLERVERTMLPIAAGTDIGTALEAMIENLRRLERER